MEVEIFQLKAAGRWLRNHKISKKWMMVGAAFILVGVLIIMKGPAQWLIEWMDERDAIINEGKGVWEYE